MTTTNQPFGLLAVRNRSGGAAHTMSVGSRTQGINGISASDGNVMYIGCICKFTSSGVITRGAANDTAIAGVFAGCEYDDVTGRHIVGYWPGTAGATNIVAYIWQDPNIIFQAQADGALAQTAVGETVSVAAATAGSTYTQRSQLTLGTGTLSSSAAGQFVIVRIVDRPDNAPSDAYTVAEVSLDASQFAASFNGF